MPSAHTTKSKDEHLIFVKNVPADLAIAAIPELFAPYEPERIKNVYPKSDITTVVVGFQTHEEASQAQQDTDGMRLENVVLRVEMYNKHRSVRFLREARTKCRPPGVVEDDFQEGYEDESPPEPVYTLPFGRAQKSQTGRATWADIVGKDGQARMATLPAAAITSPQTHPTLLNPGVLPAPQIQSAVPRIYFAPETIEATTAIVSTDDVPSHSPNASFINVASYYGDVEDNRKTKKRIGTTKIDRTVRTSIFAPWEPISTSQRISKRHCRDCVFCQMRMRS
jgi:hypothetical protein